MFLFQGNICLYPHPVTAELQAALSFEDAHLSFSLFVGWPCILAGFASWLPCIHTVLWVLPFPPTTISSCLNKYEDPDIQPPALNYGSFLKIILFILCVHTRLYAGAHVYSCMWPLEGSLHPQAPCILVLETDFSHWTWVTKKARLDG